MCWVIKQASAVWRTESIQMLFSDHTQSKLEVSNKDITNKIPKYLDIKQYNVIEPK